MVLRSRHIRLSDVRRFENFVFLFRSPERVEATSESAINTEHIGVMERKRHSRRTRKRVGFDTRDIARTLRIKNCKTPCVSFAFSFLVIPAHRKRKRNAALLRITLKKCGRPFEKWAWTYDGRTTPCNIRIGGGYRARRQWAVNDTRAPARVGPGTRGVEWMLRIKLQAQYELIE
ncbi:hypothetical protein EVAR_51305_1 [Eumeta japonica]|uniref:Uncharacterized protein n=1 Tax=Eumeta variegata TaxID=151549 RepID=A0A4C1XQC3_EUMVA|nr:hypothetical protein EVAR_51305_1 [Eumeta japonica]